MFRLDRVAAAAEEATYADLLARALDTRRPTDRESDGTWMSFAFVTETGAYVATLEAAELDLVCDGQASAAIGLRAIAVDEGWRGRGLFRALMQRALTWGRSRSDLTVLFTEEPALYERFEFQRVPQHAFVGPPPAFPTARAMRRLDPQASGDAAVIRSFVRRRTPVSSQCALLVDPDQVLENLCNADGVSIALLDAPDIVVVYEACSETLILVDVIGTEAPDLASIVGTVGPTAQRLKVLFPPDRLAWHGQPVVEDTGLMIRGPLPAAMRRPFMLPPTAEF